MDSPTRSTPDNAALLDEAAEIVRTAGKASPALLQRRLRIGHGRAVRILDELEARGTIGPPASISPQSAEPSNTTPVRRSRDGSRSAIGGVLLVGLMLGGVGWLFLGRDADEPPDATTAPSRVEGVPLPSRAEPLPDSPGRAEPSGTFRQVWAGYHVPGASHEDVLAFYNGALPVGDDFGNWTWCKLQTAGDFADAPEFAQWLYHQPGTARLLSVVVSEEDGTSTIVVGHDESGPPFSCDD